MEFSKIYLNCDLINQIYYKLNNDSLIYFSHINKYAYNIYKKINKYRIYKYINTNNYKLFRQYLNIYNYSQTELNRLGLISVNDLNIVKQNKINLYYDLRFMFELIYNKSIIDKKLISNKIIIYMINTIQKCKSFNRFETILNINKELILYSLHYNFNPDLDIDTDWLYI